jgi:NodT family efflux transporter outer membrane factor (OMF) lipoprotein
MNPSTVIASKPPRRVIRVLGVSLLAAALSACVNYRGIRSDSHPAPVSDYPTAISIPAQGGAWPAMDWSERFGDPQLTRLINEAVANSPTLAEAKARVGKASAYAEQAHAATGPSADVKDTFSREHLSGNTYLPPPIGNSWQNENSLILGASYDLDIWGKNHEALRSAISERKAAEAEEQQTRLVLSTSVAHAYVHLALLYALRDVAQNEVASRKSIGSLTRARVQTGLDNEVESRTIDVTIDATQTDVSQLDGEIATTRYQLAALLGKGPDRGLQITRPVLLAAPNSSLPDSLPTCWRAALISLPHTGVSMRQAMTSKSPRPISSPTSISQRRSGTTHSVGDACSIQAVDQSRPVRPSTCRCSTAVRCVHS